MTRKDFVLIAGAINNQRDGRGTEHDQVLNSVAYALASQLIHTNQNFDSTRFLVACGCPGLAEEAGSRADCHAAEEKC